MDINSQQQQTEIITREARVTLSFVQFTVNMFAVPICHRLAGAVRARERFYAVSECNLIEMIVYPPAKY